MPRFLIRQPTVLQRRVRSTPETVDASGCPQYAIRSACIGKIKILCLPSGAIPPIVLLYGGKEWGAQLLNKAIDAVRAPGHAFRVPDNIVAESFPIRPTGAIEPDVSKAVARPTREAIKI